MMLMCAFVATAGEFLVIVRSMPSSHACRITADTVLPSRVITRSVEANSASTTSSRLSVTPWSTISVWYPIIRCFSRIGSCFSIGSRTCQITPSPDEKPLQRQFVAHVSPVRVNTFLTWPQLVPVGFHGEPGVASRAVAERDEELHEQGGGVRFRVGSDDADKLARHPVQ